MSESGRKTYTLIELKRTAGCREDSVDECLARHWIEPVGADECDDEDLARLCLIQELRENFGANDDAIPVILHLVDQLHYLHAQLNRVTRHLRPEA